MTAEEKEIEIAEEGLKVEKGRRNVEEKEERRGREEEGEWAK